MNIIKTKLRNCLSEKLVLLKNELSLGGNSLGIAMYVSMEDPDEMD